MRICLRLLAAACVAGAIAALFVCGSRARADRDREIVELAISRIYIEYNSSGNDLGFHVFLDGEDWRKIKISNPRGRRIFEVEGKGSYRLGLTELFFEGTEPSLDDVPLDELLALFPEGEYEFSGKTVDGSDLTGTGILTHAVPAPPSNLSAELGASNSLVIRWDPVTGPPEGFPDRPITIIGYQVIAGSFQVTLPASSLSVTVPPEFVASLAAGAHQFEVLAIESGGNQTITEGSFTVP